MTAVSIRAVRPRPERAIAVVRLAAVAATLAAAGGCAALSPSQPQLDLHALAYVQAGQACTDVIAASGGMVRLCQTERTLDVFESGLAASPRATSSDLVDDPQVLAALPEQLSLRPELAASRRIVSRTCSVADRRYLTISVDSLRRILGAGGHLVARAGQDPVATGSLAAPGPDPRDAGARALGGNDAAAR